MSGMLDVTRQNCSTIVARSTGKHLAMCCSTWNASLRIAAFTEYDTNDQTRVRVRVRVQCVRVRVCVRVRWCGGCVPLSTCRVYLANVWTSS
jgi:hypothetical protein